MNRPEELFKAHVKKFFQMRTVGCGRTLCDQQGCLSNPATQKVSGPEAAADALKLAFGLLDAQHKFCVDDPIPVLNGTNVADASQNVKKYFGTSVDGLNVVFVDDLDGLDNFYASLGEAGQVAVARALESICGQLPRVDPKFFRRSAHLFDVILQLPVLLEPQWHAAVLRPVFETLAALDNPLKESLASQWQRLGRERLEKRLALFHQAVTMRVILPPPVNSLNEEPIIVGAARAMGILRRANELAGRPLPFQGFYNETLNENLNMQEDFINWLNRQGFSFITTPFILDPATKALVLKFESKFKQLQQRDQAMRDAVRSAIMGNGLIGFNPYLVFKVRRDQLIPDTLENIVRHDPEDLKKELKVVFAGEDGVDAGGVQKEFFQLIVKEIFNPDFGMFVLDKETRTYWFSPLSQEFREFELIGIILGLAIYNSVILDVHFPGVVYKKLMGQPVGLEDIKDVSPELYRGMKSLLAFDGNVEEVYAREFAVDVDNFGSKEQHELKPGGASIPLTNDNRQEYVELFVNYQLNKSIAKQFDAFKRGFDMVVSGPAFSIFTPEELELVVCGDPVLDFEELERAAEYEDDEFNGSHQVVKWFWEAVHELSVENKKKLLHFATGSDRAPIGGLKNLRLIIQKHGSGDERLPSSHTCFNHLLLPEYSSKEALVKGLMIALDNSLGFGMI